MFNIVKPIFAHTNIYIWYPRWDSNPQNLTPQASAYTNSATRALIILLNTYIMHKVIYRATRPNATVNFFPINDIFRQVLDNEKAQGSLLEESVSIIEDNLVERFVLVWRSIEDVITFNKNPSVIEYYKQKGIHNKQYRIITNVIGETYSE